jgi:hypothetical protein
VFFLSSISAPPSNRFVVFKKKVTTIVINTYPFSKQSVYNHYLTPALVSGDEKKKVPPYTKLLQKVTPCGGTTELKDRVQVARCLGATSVDHWLTRVVERVVNANCWGEKHSIRTFFSYNTFFHNLDSSPPADMGWTTGRVFRKRRCPLVTGCFWTVFSLLIGMLQMWNVHQGSK